MSNNTVAFIQLASYNYKITVKGLKAQQSVSSYGLVRCYCNLIQIEFIVIFCSDFTLYIIKHCFRKLTLNNFYLNKITIASKQTVVLLTVYCDFIVIVYSDFTLYIIEHCFRRLTLNNFQLASYVVATSTNYWYTHLQGCKIS